MSKTAILVGASGLVGQSCLRLLLEESTYSSVKVVVRKSLSIQHPKLEQIVVDFDHLENYASSIIGDEVFCCLGTTIKVAGSKENFYKVDFTYVYEIAKIALTNGAKGFYLVSALGADAQSFIFYSKVKGQIEEAVRKLNYPSTYIFRPSLLLGERKEHRAGEKIGVYLDKILSPLLFGSWKQYRGIQASQVAKAMVKKSLDRHEGIFVILSDAIQTI